jgi:hypothetical protein
MKIFGFFSTEIKDSVKLSQNIGNGLDREKLY